MDGFEDRLDRRGGGTSNTPASACHGKKAVLNNKSDILQRLAAGLPEGRGVPLVSMETVACATDGFQRFAPAEKLHFKP